MEDLQKVAKFFESHNPFNVEGSMMFLVSGIIDEQYSVTCDDAETIGANYQEN